MGLKLFFEYFDFSCLFNRSSSNSAPGNDGQIFQVKIVHKNDFLKYMLSTPIFYEKSEYATLFAKFWLVSSQNTTFDKGSWKSCSTIPFELD